MSPSALSGDYELLNSLTLPLLIIGFLIVAVGTYLRYDGRPGHQTLGTISAGVGFVATMIGHVVATQMSAEDTLACSLRGERCVTDPGAFFWDRLLSPIVLDIIVLSV